MEGLKEAIDRVAELAVQAEKTEVVTIAGKTYATAIWYGMTHLKRQHPFRPIHWFRFWSTLRNVRANLLVRK